MRIGYLFGIQILLLVATRVDTVVGQNSSTKSLNLIIDQLASVGRLINGIALQKDFAGDRNAVHRISSEFLHLESDRLIDEVKQLSSGNLSYQLDELYISLENVTDAQTDFAESNDAWMLTMKKIRGASENDWASPVDPSVDMKQRIANAAGIVAADYYNTSQLMMLSGVLDRIQRISFAKVQKPLQFMLLLRKQLVEVERKLNLWINHANGLQALAKIRDSAQNFRSLVAMINTIDSFRKRFEGFQDLKDDLDNMVDRMKDLPVVHAQKEKMMRIQAGSSQIKKTILRVQQHQKKMRRKKRRMSGVIAGFPNGLEDLKLLFLELKTPKFSKLLAQGKSTKQLENSLGILSAFNGMIDFVKASWNESFSNANLEANYQVLVILDLTITVLNEVPLNFTKPTQHWNRLKNCFENLTMSDQEPDHRIAEMIVERVLRLGTDIDNLLKAFGEKQAFFAKELNEVKGLQKVLEGLTKNSDVAAQTSAWNAFNDKAKLRDMVRDLRDTSAWFEDVGAQKVFRMLSQVANYSWNHISQLIADEDAETARRVFGCVHQFTNSSLNVNIEDITKAMKFAAMVSAVRYGEQHVGTMKQFLDGLSGLQADFRRIEQLVNNARQRMDSAIQNQNQTTQRRRKRAASSQSGPEKSLATLSNVEEVTMNLVRGIEVLRDYGKLLEHQQDLLAVANAADPLASFIQSFQDTNQIWKDRNQMAIMVSDLKKLEQWAAQMKMDNISTLWAAFEQASRVPGTQINAKRFFDMVHDEVKHHTDPVIQNSSETFDNLSQLHLNFGSHRVALQRAARTLPPLDDFFNQFFDLKTSESWSFDNDVGDEQGDGIPEFSWSDVITGVAFLLFVVIIAGFFLAWKGLKKRNKMTHRERHWIYEAFYFDKTPQNDILKAVELKSLVNIKSLVKQGCYVDVFGPYKNPKGEYVIGTPLYQAVDKALPKIAEALLIGGADRDIWTSEKQTTVQLLEMKLADPECSAQKTDLKQIETLFKKHSKHKYALLARDLLPIEKFRIGWLDDKAFIGTPIAKRFKSSFGFLFVNQRDIPEMTHIILPVDENGVLDIGKFSLGEKGDTLNLTIVYFVLCSPIILVKPIWMEECLKGDKNLHKDYKHRITKVLYNGKEYASVDGWKEWARRFAIPYLYNIDIAYYIPEGTEQHKENGYFERIVRALGGNFVTVTNLINGAAQRTSRPYWHPKFSRHWIVHKDEYTAQVDNELTKPCYSPEDLQTEFTMMPIEAFFEIMLESKGVNGFDPTRKPNAETNELVSNQDSNLVSTQKSSIKSTMQKPTAKDSTTSIGTTKTEKTAKK